MKSFSQFFYENNNSIPDDTPYEVIDTKTKEIVWKGTYKNRNIARRVVDRRDNKYGGYRFLARIAKPKTVIREYRHNLADGTSAPSIQAHNGKDPNRVSPDKKNLHTIGPYKKTNPKMNVPGSILTPLELLDMGISYEHGKVFNNIKNSGMGIEMTSINGQPVGRVFKAK